jgi:hypothetical protein
LQRGDKAPEQLQQVDVGDRIAVGRPVVTAEALLGKREDLTPALVACAEPDGSSRRQRVLA